MPGGDSFGSAPFPDRRSIRVHDVPISAIQGTGLLSPLGGRRVRTRGVVTGRLRKGFFLQDPQGDPAAAASCGVFVFAPRAAPPPGALVQVDGDVVDFVAEENDRPTTQVAADRWDVLHERGPDVPTVWLDARLLERPAADLARELNALEGMVVGVDAGAVFLAPSNPFGDYVVLPAGVTAPRTRHGGVRLDPAAPHRWYPSFRVRDYARAPRVSVGSRLLAPVVGPLNYRAAAYQIAAGGEVRVQTEPVDLPVTSLASDPDHLTVLTLNGFNLDPRIEDPTRVQDPRRDVDDDVGDGRFDMLARAIVSQAGAPDLIALQEIQDDDGAEITPRVTADATYRHLAEAVRAHRGPAYRWADLPPAAGRDGGQPGGNIRNGFLYDPARLELVPGTLRRLGEADPAFDDSRKPLAARFRRPGDPRGLEVINVHLASKRHQRGPFAPELPGFDPRADVRRRQAEAVRDEAARLEAAGADVYVTGDFNDGESSPALAALTVDGRVNLAERIPPEERYDYNHRGVSQSLMHGVASAPLAARPGTAYEILHGNELIGVQPGEMGGKPTDHAYVLARLALG